MRATKRDDHERKRADEYERAIGAWLELVRTVIQVPEPEVGHD